MNQGLDTLPAYTNTSNEYPTGYDADQELSNLAMFVDPLLTYPDQYILVCTGNQGLLIYSENARKVLSPYLGSKAELWQTLGSWSSDAGVLTDHILDMLAQPDANHQAAPLSVSFMGKPYTVDTRFIVGIDTPRNLILSLLPEAQAIPKTATPRFMASLGCGSFLGLTNTRQSAREYTMKLNDYVKNCRNDDIYYKEGPEQDGVDMSWQASRRGSLLGEFIPSMCRPELTHYQDMVKDQRDVVSLRLSMDTYHYDPVDPDSIPPSFIVNNTTNTGDTGAQIARKSNQGNNNSNGDKRCYTCGTEKSPEWRKGPEGPKTLCNACGLRYAKQLRAGNA